MWCLIINLMAFGGGGIFVFILFKSFLYYVCVPLNRQTWERNMTEAWSSVIR